MASDSTKAQLKNRDCPTLNLVVTDVDNINLPEIVSYVRKLSPEYNCYESQM
ncbi:hypothetical protein HanRHA438_Chr03g0139011 [Helianthus annuus]|nr:hypothetical protein HanIR_Chr03g0138911 [Helianthus annuus]KAJ0937160.1 hypothetical protein HanRHA438_Chr03g0139011 [Helianthus annuus]